MDNERDNTYIRFDWAMKHMLRDKSNFGILEGLISVLLNEKVSIVELLESESNQDSHRESSIHVDIQAIDASGNPINIKIQLMRKIHYLQRIVYRKRNPDIEPHFLDEKCHYPGKVYSINILYWSYGQGDDYVYHGETRFKGIHTGNDLLVNTREEGVIVPHLPREVFPEYYLVRVNVYDKIPETPLDEWLTYLKTGKVKEDTRTPGLQEVIKKLRYLSMSAKERRDYDAHMDTIMVQNDVLDTAREEGIAQGREEGIAQGRAEGREEGIAQGRAEGREEGRAEGRAEGLYDVARNMITRGMPDDIIRELTGLSDIDIYELRNQAK